MPEDFCPSCGGRSRDGCDDEFHESVVIPVTPELYLVKLSENEARHLRLAIRASQQHYTAEEWSVLSSIEKQLLNVGPVEKPKKTVYEPAPWPYYAGMMG